MTLRNDVYDSNILLSWSRLCLQRTRSTWKSPLSVAESRSKHTGPKSKHCLTSTQNPYHGLSNTLISFPRTHPQRLRDRQSDKRVRPMARPQHHGFSFFLSSFLLISVTIIIVNGRSGKHKNQKILHRFKEKMGGSACVLLLSFPLGPAFVFLFNSFL
jgi:hypothetical protein